MLQLAIDSLPLGGHLLAGTDYSGLQLYGLGTIAAQELLEGAAISDNGFVLRASFGNDVALPNNPAVAFAAGLDELLRAQPWLRATLLRKLRRIRAGGREIELTFGEPVAGVQDVLRMPNWVAFAKGRPICTGSLRRVDVDQWHLVGRDGTISHQVMLVRSVSQNEQLSRNGHLDFTADTCVDYTSIDESYVQRDTGLHAYLVPTSLRVSFAKVIEDLDDFRYGLEQLAKPLATHELPATGLDSVPLAIAYDDFYPNQEICEHLRVHLVRKGWNACLVRDDYYRPTRPGDCKLVIKRVLTEGPLFRAYAMLEFAQTRRDVSALMPHILRAEAGLNVDCHKVLKDIALARPIVAIPSVYRCARPGVDNPLIRNLVSMGAGNELDR